MLKDNLHSLPLSAPVNVTWEITRRCNLHCRHCLSRDRMASCDGDMSLKEAQRFIDQLIEANVFQVNIGGGEPFIREDIWDILAYCHKNKLVTCISTNGSLIDKEIAARLAGLPYTYLQVSLDGADEKTNDPIRGDGTYAFAIAAINNLTKAGFKNLSINTVVTRANFHQLPALYLLAKEYGAKPRLSRFRPSGAGSEVWEEYRLTKEQTLELADILSAHKDITTGDSFFSITRDDRKHLGLNMCGGAKMTCSVSPEGNIYPCAFLQEDEFLAGNILKEQFIDIWRNSPVLRKFRDLNPKACTDCSRFDLCHGGCPAIAWYIKKDINAGDPACIQNMG